MIETIATSVGEKAKHTEFKTAADMISHSHMNWRPYLVKTAYWDADTETTDRMGATQQNAVPHPEWKETPQEMQVLRSDTRAPLGRVGANYQRIPNKNAFSIADPIISQGGKFIGCGEYEGGALAWVQIEMPIEPADIIKGDAVHPYLLIVTGHTGNRGLTYKMTSIRVVCKNTLYAALRGQTNQEGSIRHSGDIESKVSVASDLLDKHRLFFLDTVGIFQSFAATTITQPTVERYFKTIAKVEPKHYKRDEVTGEHEMVGRPATMYDRYMTAYHGDRGGAELGRGTLWGAYNAVTYVQDHDMVEEKRKKTAAKSANDRAAYQYFEASPRVGREAFDLAIDFQTGAEAIASN